MKFSTRLLLSFDDIAAAKDWLFEAAQDPDTPPVVLYEAYRLLEAIDSPAVLDVTKSLRDHRSVARARLANGDAAAGAIKFAERRWFAPAVNDRELDAILASLSLTVGE